MLHHSISIQFLFGIADMRFGDVSRVSASGTAYQELLTQVTSKVVTPLAASAVASMMPPPLPLAPPVTVQVWPTGWVSTVTPYEKP
jgi:hypothetical protein